MDVRVGLWRKLSAEELMLLNCGVEKTLESPLDCKEIQPVHPKGDQSSVFIGRTDPEAENPVLWPPHANSWLIRKDPDAGRDWGRRRRGWQRMRWFYGITDWWTWVWVNSGSWWRTGRSGVLWFMGLQRVGHDWATELKTHQIIKILSISLYVDFTFLCHFVFISQLFYAFHSVPLLNFREICLSLDIL